MALVPLLSACGGAEDFCATLRVALQKSDAKIRYGRWILACTRIEADLRRQALGKDETGLIMGCGWGQPEPLCAALCGSLGESGLLLPTVDECFM
jgi:hypothetical protein